MVAKRIVRNKGAAKKKLFTVRVVKIDGNAQADELEAIREELREQEHELEEFSKEQREESESFRREVATADDSD